MVVQNPQDTYLNYDLYVDQQTWDEDDWARYDEQCFHDQIEREIAWENATDEQKHEAAYYEGLHDSTCDETFAINQQLPPGYAVTWYVASVWPRFVLWHGDTPIALYKNEHKENLVPYAVGHLAFGNVAAA